MQVKTQFLILVALAGLGAASPALSLPLAADVSPVAGDSFTPQRSRAQVHAEAVAAVAAGRPVSKEFDSEPAPVLVSTTTRAQTQAAAVEALRLGQIGLGEASAPEAAALARQTQAGWRTAVARGAGH